MASQQQCRMPIPHNFPMLILRIAERFFPRKGLIEQRGRGRGQPFQMLPDDVLLDIFDLYGIDSCNTLWWCTLVHVCRRWRQIIFASPHRLGLRISCTPRTRVSELLDFLPPSMPIMINNFNFISNQPQPCPTLSLEDGSQLIAAIEQHDRVCRIHLQGLSSSLSEKLGTMLQEKFPTLTHVLLWASDEIDEIAPALPEGCLGSAPLLTNFWLKGIAFPELPKFLLSTSNLVQLRLENIPDSGYFSPTAMVTSLSTCSKLEALVIEFLSPYPHPDLTCLASQQSTSLARSSLPALILFSFKGNGAYLDEFVPGIDNPLVVIETKLSLDRYVAYEASFTPSGFLFRYRHGYLDDMESEEEGAEEEAEEAEEEEGEEGEEEEEEA